MHADKSSSKKAVKLIYCKLRELQSLPVEQTIRYRGTFEPIPVPVFNGNHIQCLAAEGVGRMWGRRWPGFNRLRYSLRGLSIGRGLNVLERLDRTGLGIDTAQCLPFDVTSCT